MGFIFQWRNDTKGILEELSRIRRREDAIIICKSINGNDDRSTVARDRDRYTWREFPMVFFR